MSAEKSIEDLGDLGDLLRGPNRREHLLMLQRGYSWLLMGMELMDDDERSVGYERRKQWIADAKFVTSKLREICELGWPEP